MKTGRKFKCIGKEAKIIRHWSVAFNVGQVYEELVHDFLPQDEDDGTLCLYSEINDGLWVDSSQFEQVTE